MNNKVSFAGCVLSAILFAIPLHAQDGSESEAYAIARGGRLYDNWFAEKEIQAPAVANPAYPESGRYKGVKGADWRCKECHGWDYRGRDGAYRDGKHATGTAGVSGVVGVDPARIVERLGDANHPYSAEMLDERDRLHLALFLSRGQLEMGRYVDAASARSKGEPGRGRGYYQTVCAVCHGLDGKGEETPPLGRLADENPWEVLHKIRNGQPKWEMPALRAFDPTVAADIVRYLQDEMPEE